MSNKAYSSYTIVDVTDGMNWLGELTQAPSNPKQSDAYYNTQEKKSYLYDGERWVVFSQDGPQGEQGSSIKKIDTYVRDFPYYAESGYSWTGIKAGGTTAFVDPGHSETWTANSPYDNSHIRVGDIAYLVGTVKDQFSADGIKQSIILYGNVTKVNSQGVTMTTTNVVWGGTSGINTAVVMLYQRASSAPTNKPANGAEYAFSSGKLSGDLGDWSQTIPSGTNPCYVIQAVASGAGATDTINSSEWSEPVILVQDYPPVYKIVAEPSTLKCSLGETHYEGRVDWKVMKTVTNNDGTIVTEISPDVVVLLKTLKDGSTEDTEVYSTSFKPNVAAGSAGVSRQNRMVALAIFPNGTTEEQILNDAVKSIDIVNIPCIREVLEEEEGYSLYSHTYVEPDSTKGEVGEWKWKRSRIKTSAFSIEKYDANTKLPRKTRVTITYSEWSDWELACGNAAEVKAFNALTNNGEFEGHFYGVYVWTNGTSAYFNDPADDGEAGYTKYLVKPEDIDIANDILYIDANGNRVDTGIEVLDNIITSGSSDGKTLKSYIDYYVNASMIQTGSLLVGTETEPIFEAGFDKKSDGSHTVKIAGFDVNNISLQSTKRGYVYLGTDAIKLGGNANSPVFSVNANGLMQMTKGSIKLGTKSGGHHPFEVNDQGEMYSAKGNVGGWNINEVGLYNSTPEQQVYLKRIYYSFAQGTSLDQTVENAASLAYQDSLIDLSSFFPIFVKRTFDYGNFTLSTITKMTIRTQQGADSWVTAYNIYYSNDKTKQLPSSIDNPGAFERWSKWLPTRNELYDYICVNWSASSDSGFDPLVPYDSGTNVSSTAGISTLTDYRLKTSAYYFGCNNDENIQNSSLLDDSNSTIVFYAGGNILNLQEAAFQVLRDGSVYMKALQVDRLISKGQELNFGVVDKRISGNTYRSGITMYSGDTQLLTQSSYGFYIGFDGANFGQLYLSGKKVNIDSSDGHLYIIP